MRSEPADTFDTSSSGATQCNTRSGGRARVRGIGYVWVVKDCHAQRQVPSNVTTNYNRVVCLTTREHLAQSSLRCRAREHAGWQSLAHVGRAYGFNSLVNDLAWGHSTAIER